MTRTNTSSRLDTSSQFFPSYFSFSYSIVAVVRTHQALYEAAPGPRRRLEVAEVGVEDVLRGLALHLLEQFGGVSGHFAQSSFVAASQLSSARTGHIPRRTFQLTIALCTFNAINIAVEGRVFDIESASAPNGRRARWRPEPVPGLTPHGNVDAHLSPQRAATTMVSVRISPVSASFSGVK